MIRASQLAQARACPGSVRAQEGLPEQVSDDSSLGTLLHSALAGDKEAVAKLDANGVELLQKTVVKREDMSQQYSEGGTVLSVHLETLLAKPPVSGHPDEIIVLAYPDGTRKALVWDFKSGWKEQAEPAVNLQLRAYAYLVFANFPFVTEVVAGLIPSRFDVPTPVRYSRDDVMAIKDEIFDILIEAEKPDAKRIPSFEACRYCLAKATDRCPETLQLPAVFNQPLNINTLTPETKSILLEQCEMGIDRIKTIREKLKPEVAEGRIPGWELKPGRKDPVLASAAEVFQAVQEYVDPDHFQEALDLSAPKLRVVLAKAMNWSKADAKKNTDDLLGSLLTYKECAPSLVRSKKKLEEA